MIREFSKKHAGSGDAEFRQWLAENPDGFFVNLTSGRTGLLHRGDCPHMKYPPDDLSNLVTRRKWVADSRRELEDHAREKGIELSDCDSSRCHRP